MKRVIVALSACLMISGALSAKEPFRQAERVWGEKRDAANSYLRFCTSFDVKGGCKPVLRVTASTVYRAFLNDKFLGYGPARTAEGCFKVDECPLSGANEGRNELVIEVAGYKCKSYQYVIQSPFLQAEVVAEGKVLAATPGSFTATDISRETKGPVYSRQRGFPGERYVVDPDSKPVAVALAACDASATNRSVRLLPRGVPYPEFKVKEWFTPVVSGESKIWSAPFNDTGFIGFKVKVDEPGVFAIRFDEALVDGKIDLFRNGDPSNS